MIIQPYKEKKVASLHLKTYQKITAFIFFKFFLNFTYRNCVMKIRQPCK